MAPVLLDDERLDRRTLIWMATYNHTNEPAFKNKPLAIAMLDKKKTPVDMIRTKGDWFYRPIIFKSQITDHFEPA
jgi:hypothetical protein